MNVFEQLIYMLQKRVSVPSVYGLYHIVTFALIILMTAWLCIRFRDAEEKTVRRILLTAWIFMVIGEVVKCLLFALTVTDGVASWSFPWHAFPFQLCSTPLYVLPIAIFCRGRIRETAHVFLMTFSLVGGLAVLIYPESVFTEFLGINIQTMMHHGLQVALGIYLAVCERRNLNLRHFAKAVPAFLMAAIVALILNIGVYHIYAAKGGGIPEFNMFFISPYFDTNLPIVGDVYAAVSYPVFLTVYLLGLPIVALIPYYTILGIYRFVLRKKEKI